MGRDLDRYVAEGELMGPCEGRIACPNLGRLIRDPYQYELFFDDVQMFLCADCEDTRRDDV